MRAKDDRSIKGGPYTGREAYMTIETISAHRLRRWTGYGAGLMARVLIAGQACASGLF
jgi:hypothetical protein